MLYKPDRKYATRIIMGVVLYPFAVALISLSTCEYASLVTVPFVSDAWAQPAEPAQPVAPPAQQEAQNLPKPQQEQAGPKPPEAAPAGPAQPPPGQPSPEQKQPEQAPKGPEEGQEQITIFDLLLPQELTGPKPPEEPKKPAEEQEETTIIDILHSWTDRSILTSATWLDSFFGNQRYLAESNQSYIRVRYNVFLEHESPMLIRPDLQIRIVLPQLKERTHLEFAGTPKETTSLNVTQAPAATDQFTNPGDKNVTAGVSQFIRDTNRVSFVVRAGLQWHQGGPVVILGPRLRVQFPLDHWTFRFIEEDILRNDSGWSAKHTFDLERPLSKTLFFRATNDWIQTDHVDGFIYDYAFNIAHPLSPKKALEYEWVNI
ncbi:MAG TPA: hypothetical protein VMM54_10070, partial [Nitrospirota bacterium]|nr:hypothetical protein [Nitrospirota bacterium]